MKKKLKGILAFIATVTTLFSTAVTSACASPDELLCIHKWDNGQVTVEATCSKEGEKFLTCLECGSTKTVKTVKIPHTPKIIPAVPATCTEDGLTDGRQCTVCNGWISKPQVVKALGHTVVNDSAVSPTCTEQGLTAGEHCSRCDTVLEEQSVVEAKGHTVVMSGVTATCFYNGRTAKRYCEDCATVFAEDEFQLALGHHFVDNYCTDCGMIDLIYLSTMNEGTDYTLSNIASGTLLEKGAIYRVENPEYELLKDAYLSDNGSSLVDSNGEYIMEEGGWAYAANAYIFDIFRVSCSFNNTNYYVYDEEENIVSTLFVRSQLLKNKGTQFPINGFVFAFNYGITEEQDPSNDIFFNKQVKNSVAVSKDLKYFYIYIVDNTFSDENVTVNLLANKGCQKVTLK